MKGQVSRPPPAQPGLTPFQAAGILMLYAHVLPRRVVLCCCTRIAGVWVALTGFQTPTRPNRVGFVFDLNSYPHSKAGGPKPQIRTLPDDLNFSRRET